MKDKPKVYGDSWWADLANALAMKPVYRKPISQPRASTFTPPPATAPKPTATEPAEKISPNIETAPTKEEAIDAARKLLSEQAPLPRATETSSVEVATEDAQWRIDTPGSGDKAGTESTDVADDIVEPQQEQSATTPAPAPKHVTYAPENVDVQDYIGKAVSARGSRTQRSEGIKTNKIMQALKPWQKLTKQQLRTLGLSAQEAAVAEGIFRGWNTFRIAAQTKRTEPQVDAVVKHLMAKFDVTQTHSLRKILWAMHRDRKPFGSLLKIKPSDLESGLIVSHRDDGEIRALKSLGLVPSVPPKVTSKPPQLGIHGDGPTYDKVGFTKPKPKAEAKREPAKWSDDPQM